MASVISLSSLALSERPDELSRSESEQAKEPTMNSGVIQRGCIRIA
jgi:hypothetical protein